MNKQLTNLIHKPLPTALPADVIPIQILISSWTNKHTSWTNTSRGEPDRTRRFFAVGAVSNNPHSYSIQKSLSCSNFKESLVLHKKMEKFDLGKFHRHPETWSRESVVRSPPNANRSCGHVLGWFSESGERNGPVVVEIEPENAWGGLPIMGRSRGEGQKINFRNWSPNTTKL